jgi:hypothetical protein
VEEETSTGTQEARFSGSPTSPEIGQVCNRYRGSDGMRRWVGLGIIAAAWRVRSPVLLAFGGDGAIELFSAVVVLWRFRTSAAHEGAEKRAARVAGALLFALAALVAITSVTSLLGYSEPKPTFLGIAI